MRVVDTPAKNAPNHNSLVKKEARGAPPVGGAVATTTEMPVPPQAPGRHKTSEQKETTNHKCHDRIFVGTVNTATQYTSTRPCKGLDSCTRAVVTFFTSFMHFLLVKGVYMAWSFCLFLLFVVFFCFNFCCKENGFSKSTKSPLLVHCIWNPVVSD